MSDDKDKKAPKAPGSGGGGPKLLGAILPAVFAAGAAFGGAKLAGGNKAPVVVEHVAEGAKPPGPTLALEPFLVTVPDVNRKNHPMKVTIAIEFVEGAKDAKEEMLKGLTPRVRDASLGYFRTLAYEAVIDSAANDKIRIELLDKLHASGMPSAERVLITDLVVQ